MNRQPETFKAVRVSDRVYWVGAIDWAVRDFHGYLTSRGATYNAYLILADKITLVDTVKATFRDELLARVSSVVNLRDIKYVISNHSEMDHSGCLPEVIEAIRPEKVFASAMGVKALADHFHMGRDIVALKDGDKLSLGNANLSFMETRMVHWPDSMFTYLAEDRLLFSQDGFGMHLASSERFADELPVELLEYEGAKYFANILTLYIPQISKALDKVKSAGWDIGVIAPDHGPIWRRNLDRIIGYYVKWLERKPANKAVIVFDTMWNSTMGMARAIGEGLAANGTSIRIMPLRSCHRSDVVTEMLDAGALLVGSPTINNNMFPTVADFLCYARGLKFTNLVGQAFGSYGWSGESVADITAIMKEMKVRLIGEPIRVKYVPDNESLKKCYNLGEQVSQALKGAAK